MSIYGHTVLTYHTQMVRCEKEPFTFVGNLLNQGVTLPPPGDVVHSHDPGVLLVGGGKECS